MCLHICDYGVAICEKHSLEFTLFANIAKPISWCVMDSHDNVIMNNPDATTSWAYWQFSWTRFQNGSVTCVLSLVWINRSWYLYNPVRLQELQFSHDYCDTSGILTGAWKTDVSFSVVAMFHYGLSIPKLNCHWSPCSTLLLSLSYCFPWILLVSHFL